MQEWANSVLRIVYFVENSSSSYNEVIESGVYQVTANLAVYMKIEMALRLIAGMK